MADDFFAPLLSDVYGLFGGGHGMTEGPPVELEEGASASALEQFNRMEPVMRGLVLPFLKAARKREHNLVLLPALYGLDEYLEPSAARMSETAIGQIGDTAARLKKPQAFPAHHVADETKTATTGLLYHFRVAYYDKELRQALSRRDVRPDRWLDLAHLAGRFGLRPGCFLPEPDVALFQHPEPQPTPSRDLGLIAGAKLKKMSGMDPDAAVKFAMDIIAKYDACYLDAYPDPITGNAPWLIGYGASGPSIGRTTLWDMLKATSDLEARAKKYLATIMTLVTVRLPSNSYGALLSLAYNIGLPAFKKSTLLKRVNAGKFGDVVKEFAQWTKVEGKAVPRLATRRTEESDLFLEGLTIEKQDAKPKAKDGTKPAPEPKPAVKPEPKLETKPTPGPTPKPTQAPAGKKYIVKKGDTLPGLAHMFFQAGDLWHLLWKNNKSVIGKDWTKIERGMELVIPDMKTLKKEEIMESKQMSPKYKNPPR